MTTNMTIMNGKIVLQEIVSQVKSLLLQCATADGIIRLDEKVFNQKIQSNALFLNIFDNSEVNKLMKAYFSEQHHNSFSQFLQMLRDTNTNTTGCAPQQSLIQITTHSKLLSSIDLKRYSDSYEIRCESLLSFNTQQQLIEVIKEFLKVEDDESDDNEKQEEKEDNERVKNSNNNNKKARLLIIQCDCANFYSELISCTRYTIVDQYTKYQNQGANLENAYIILIVQVPKVAGGCFWGFQTAKWLCYHIDDLDDEVNIGNMYEYKEKSISEIFGTFTLVESDDKIDRINLTRFLESSIYLICSKISDHNAPINDTGAGSAETDSSPKKEAFIINNRAIQRVEILAELFKHEQNEFVRTLLNKCS